MKKISIRDLLHPFSLSHSKRPSAALKGRESEIYIKQTGRSSKNCRTSLVITNTFKWSDFLIVDKVTLYFGVN